MCVWGGGVQMYRKIAILSLACLLGTASGAAVDLNKDNFNAQVYDSGKTAFVKFFAPWSVAVPPGVSMLSDRHQRRWRFAYHDSIRE